RVVRLVDGIVRAEIITGAEGGPGPAQDGHLHVGIGIGLLQSAQDGAAQLVVEGVALLGAIHHEPPHAGAWRVDYEHVRGPRIPPWVGVGRDPAGQPSLTPYFSRVSGRSSSPSPGASGTAMNPSTIFGRSRNSSNQSGSRVGSANDSRMKPVGLAATAWTWIWGSWCAASGTWYSSVMTAAFFQVVRPPAHVESMIR